MSGLLHSGRPSPADLHRMIQEASGLWPSYGSIGQVGPFQRPGYSYDTRSAEIGAGRGDYERAKTALREWRMFDLDWLELHGGDAAPHAGQTVAVLVPLFGIWWVNLACVAVTYDEESEAGGRFGFVYVTMPQHAEIGQERFEALWDRPSGEVRFHIEAISRPSRWFMWPGYPWVRRLQRRFGVDAMQAMRRAVADAGGAG